MVISSRQNDRVKAIRALREKKERDQTGAFFAEGERLLRAALQTGAAFELIVLAPDRLTRSEAALVDALEELQAPLLEVTPEVFDTLAFREEGQSVGAVIAQRWETLSSVSETRRCWLALHDIQHPGNLGTLIRTCDAIGGDGVILTGRSTDPYHPIAVRGSLGALFSQRIVRSTPQELARWLPHSGCSVIGTSPDGSKDYREIDYASRPVVIMGGNERVGISTEQIAQCDELVRIPMAGYVESLNLSVATALVLYEVLRQRERAGV
ncbi:MAG TPA: RNA methyltransferase [Dehalococcoidia bacterium]|jgi:TrmH family RNA methyltransferase|nr:RNA methyltransferase [Dehalococcoidia bacterium]